MSILRSTVLGLLLVMPILGEATPVPPVTTIEPSLGALNSTTNFYASFNDSEKGIFTDQWDFTVTDNGGIAASATNVSIQTYGFITGFRGWLDGIDLNLNAINASPITVQLLSGGLGGSLSGAHTLIFSGDAGLGAGYGGSVSIAPLSAVPVPAAVWLMGSAMVGLFSFRKRKTTMVASTMVA